MAFNEAEIPRRVLIVDDDELVRESVAALVRQAGCTAVVAGDGMAALTALGREWFPVVVTDRTMPVLDGIEFAQRVRALSVAPTYIVMLTASGDALDYERGYCAGVDHYIHKKSFEAELLQKVLSGFRAVKRRQVTVGARGTGPIVIDLENGAHTARHLIGRMSAEMAHAVHAKHELAVVSICIEPAPAAAGRGFRVAPASDALLRATIGAVRPRLDWVARLPLEPAACRLAVIMPFGKDAEVAALEQGVRNALVHAADMPALRAARLTFGTASLAATASQQTAVALLSEAERRRRGVHASPQADLSAVQGKAA